MLVAANDADRGRPETDAQSRTAEQAQLDGRMRTVPGVHRTNAGRRQHGYVEENGGC